MRFIPIIIAMVRNKVLSYLFVCDLIGFYAFSLVQVQCSSHSTELLIDIKFIIVCITIAVSCRLKSTQIEQRSANRKKKIFNRNFQSKTQRF